MKHKTLFLLPLLLLTSCNQTSISKPQEEMMTIIDMKERTVELKKDIERICITFNIEEYLAIGGKGSEDKIVGFSHSYWKGRRNDAYDAYLSSLPSLKDKTDIGYAATLNVETIINTRPDVVLASKAADYTYLENNLGLLEKAKIPVVFFDYHTDTKETIRKSNEILGKILHQEKRAEEISDYYDSKVTPIFEKAKTIKSEERPSVYMEFSKGKGVYGNTWSNKMWGSLIEQVGGNNIAKDISDANSVDMAKEAIIAKNPDLIVLSGCLQSGLSGNVILGYNQKEEIAKKNLESYLTREEWKTLPAVRNRNLKAVYHDLSRHVFDFAGVMFLAKACQPEIFKDLDPLTDLKDFFKTYMPFELQGTFMVEL